MDKSLKLLETLHECLAKELLGKIQSGEAKAGDLNVARQFLKDNGVTFVKNGVVLDDESNKRFLLSNSKTS